MIKILNKILWPAEILALVTSAAALAISNDEVFMIGMSTLAAVYFMKSYTRNPPVESSASEPEKPGDFFDLLGNSIGPKVTWIACSVVVTGVNFLFLHLKGALEMLRIGSTALIAAILILGAYSITRNSDGIMSVLYRAIPVCLIGIYLLMNNPA